MTELNVLQNWENWHWKNVFQEIRESGIDFTRENIPPIVEFMSFKQRSKRNPELCPYYSMGRSCHPTVEDLNCMLCACPDYASTRLDGGCRNINSQGKLIKHKNLPIGQVWDCSNCTLYHSPEEVKKYIDENFARLEKLLRTS